MIKDDFATESRKNDVETENATCMISVIVPAYNVEAKISRCLDKLVNQTFDDYEVIIVDDGSTDNTESVCESYVQNYQHIRYVKKKNGGVSSARNLGLELALGKYIVFVDSDDYVSVDLCRGMYEAALKNDADIVIASYYTDYNQNIKKHECQREFCAYSIFDMRNDFPWIYQDCFLNSPWNKLFKKQLITELFRLDMHYFEDYYFNISYLCNCNKIEFIQDAYYYYVENSQDSLTKNFNEKTFDWIRMIYKKQMNDLYPMLLEDSRQLFEGSLIYGLYNTIQKCVYTKGVQSIRYMKEWCKYPEIQAVFDNGRLSNNSKRSRSLQIELTIGLFLLKIRCYVGVYGLFMLKKTINPLLQKIKNTYRNHN